MNDILGITRSAVDLYGMINDGDTVAVGCSGGKDSTLLLLTLHRLGMFYPKKFRLMGLTVDIGAGADYTPLSRFCGELGIEYHVRDTNIRRIVFDVRKETNPCSLCSKMRRGALNNFAAEMGANKVALAHHRDDAVQTLMLNLVHEGRIGCFQPVTYLSRKDLTVIRPFILIPEIDLIQQAKETGIPVIRNFCGVDGDTERESMKQLLSDMEQRYPGVTKRMFGAIKRSELKGWGTDQEDKNE